MTMDAHDPVALAGFWAIALKYETARPPSGWATWEEWFADQGVPESEWGDGASIQDPEGVRPSISFLKVPESKTGKNRLHLDLQESGGRHLDSKIRRDRIEATVRSLADIGAVVIAEVHRIDGSEELDHVRARGS